MTLSSAALGIRTVGRLESFDIVLNLETIGAVQADYPSHFATVYRFLGRSDSRYSRPKRMASSNAGSFAKAPTTYCHQGLAS